MTEKLHHSSDDLIQVISWSFHCNLKNDGELGEANQAHDILHHILLALIIKHFLELLTW